MIFHENELLVFWILYFGLKFGKNKIHILYLLFCLMFSQHKVATFDGCKQEHLNVISRLGLKSSWWTKMETLPWFQARWVRLFLSLFIRLYICLFLSHFNNPCPSQLCLVHWTVTSTLAGFAFLIPLCSMERWNIWRAVFLYDDKHSTTWLLRRYKVCSREWMKTSSTWKDLYMRHKHL